MKREPHPGARPRSLDDDVKGASSSSSSSSSPSLGGAGTTTVSCSPPLPIFGTRPRFSGLLPKWTRRDSLGTALLLLSSAAVGFSSFLPCLTRAPTESAAATRSPSLPSPTTATESPALISPCSTTRRAAARGSAKAATLSGSAAGTRWRLATGSWTNSASAPSRPTMPSTVLPGSWFLARTRRSSSFS